MRVRSGHLPGENAVKAEEVSSSMKMENIDDRNIICRGTLKYGNGKCLANASLGDRKLANDFSHP